MGLSAFAVRTSSLSVPYDRGRREEALLCGSSHGPFVLLLSIFVVFYRVVYMSFMKSTFVELRRM